MPRAIEQISLGPTLLTSLLLCLTRLQSAIIGLYLDRLPQKYLAFAEHIWHSSISNLLYAHSRPPSITPNTGLQDRPHNSHLNCSFQALKRDYCNFLFHNIDSTTAPPCPLSSQTAAIAPLSLAWPSEILTGTETRSLVIAHMIWFGTGEY